MTMIQEYKVRYAQIFAQNLKKYLSESGMSQNELARRLNVTSATVSTWCRAEKYPTIERIDALCDIFHCERVDLTETAEASARYHQNQRLLNYANLIAKNDVIATCVDLLKNVSMEDMPRVIEMIKIFAKEEPHEET